MQSTVEVMMREMINKIFPEQSPPKTALYLYLICVLASLAYFFISFDTLRVDLLDVDEMYYYSHAEKIFNGTYVLNTFRPIGHAAMLSSILWITRNHFVMTQLIVTLLACLRAPLIYLNVRSHLNLHQVGCLAALVGAIWPTYLFYSVSIYSETFSFPFFLAFLLVLPSRPSQSRWIRWFGAGILLGWCILLHPMYLLYIPFLFVVCYFEGHSFRRAIPHFAKIMIATCLVIIPWSTIASIHEGGFVLLSTYNGDVLARAMNPRLLEEGFSVAYSADGRKTWSGPGKAMNEKFLSPEERKMPPIQRNAILRKKVFNWIKEHPWDALTIEFYKIISLWGFYPFAWVLLKRNIVGNIPSIILLVFGVASMVRFRSYYRFLSRYWTLPLFCTLVALISAAPWRYRMSADFGLIVLSMLLVWSLVYKVPPAKLLNPELG